MKLRVLNMALDTDTQTISDLYIFPHGRDDVSVFDYYNRTQTNGGRDLLSKMMNNPLNDLEEINSRICLIKFIYDNDLYCTIERKELDAIEYYLNMTSDLLKDNIIDSFSTFVSDAISPSNEYYLISRGHKCLYTHFRNLIVFFSEIDSEELPDFLAQFKTEIDKLTEQPNLKLFIDRKRKKQNFRHISKLDNLFRKKEKETIKKLLELTYLLDVYMSVASVAEKKKLGFPTFVEAAKPEIEIDSFFHPLIDNAVSNNIQLSNNQNLCFVSGSNMAGKSTLLKSVGLCVYLSHVGFPVPATKMKTSVFNGLYTTINIADNINKGYSHYYSEVKRIKDIALLIKEKKKVFVVFDELFRGTNVKDAFDATLLITQAFTRIRSSIFFISTHIVEVGAELEKSERICFWHLESKLKGEQPVYTYKLKNGISTERLGLTILKKERITELIDEIAENEMF